MERYSVFDPIRHDADLELGLTDPGSQDQSEHGLDHGIDVVPNGRNSPSLLSRARALQTSLIIYVLTAVFTVLYCIYVHQALLSPDPQIGDFLLSAPNANVLISCFSQIFAGLVAYLLADVLNQMRWQLAARPSGVLMSIFAITSSATEWHAAVLNFLRNWDSPLAWAFGLVR